MVSTLQQAVLCVIYVKDDPKGINKQTWPRGPGQQLQLAKVYLVAACVNMPWQIPDGWLIKL